MNKPGSILIVATGAALAAAVLYDASALTRAVGLPVEGGEAIVVLAALSLSFALFVLGGLGLRGRRSAA
jgi:hypothetical protein